jgi:hypothetical protein
MEFPRLLHHPDTGAECTVHAPSDHAARLKDGWVDPGAPPVVHEAKDEPAKKGHRGKSD